jgi:hypothetical protein
MREGEAPAEPELQHNLWLRLGGSLALPFFNAPLRRAAEWESWADEPRPHC